MIYVQKQIWSTYIKYFIFDTNGGSIQLNLYSEKQDFGSTACIYALWVDENQRRKGIAKRLLDKAENIARQERHKDIVLDYEHKDTPVEIFDWYKRCGYKVEFAQMKKEL